MCYERFLFKSLPLVCDLKCVYSSLEVGIKHVIWTGQNDTVISSDTGWECRLESVVTSNCVCVCVCGMGKKRQQKINQTMNYIRWHIGVHLDQINPIKCKQVCLFSTIWSLQNVFMCSVIFFFVDSHLSSLCVYRYSESWHNHLRQEKTNTK